MSLRESMPALDGPEHGVLLGQQRHEPSLRGPVAAGLIIVLLGLGGFGVWAMTARLDSAAVASGTIIVDSRRKTVSHLEGGILRRLLVQEGDVVKAGQPVAQLDDTRAKAELDGLRARRTGLLARLARLRAEQAGLQEPQFDGATAAEAGIGPEIRWAERNLMQARRELYERKMSIQRKVIEQQSAEIEAALAQMQATTRQLEITRLELDAISGLVAKGLARRTQQSDLQGRESELIGRMADMTARRAKAEQARAGAELELLSLGNDLQQQVATDIQAAQLELADVTERITASRDVLNRIEAVSPQDGIVTNIRSHTPGGVIAAGQPIMDIVPEHEPLVVEVKVGVRDIDSARVGADVLVRLSAFNHRTLAPLPGRLVYLAADQQIDDRTGNAFFTARAELDARGLEAHPNLRLYPGMPAELLILNERRRAIDYFVAPFVESFSRAFRER